MSEPRRYWIHKGHLCSGPQYDYLKINERYAEVVLVSDLTTLRDELARVRGEADRYKKAYFKVEQDVLDKLCPALGIESEPEIGWVIGDHTSVTIAAVAAEKLAALQRAVGEARERADNLEAALRKRLWLKHGSIRNHLLYGDDGEMDCNVCLKTWRSGPVHPAKVDMRQYPTIDELFHREMEDALIALAPAPATPAKEE